MRDACRFIAERRLKANPQIERAREEFEAAGGPAALRDQNDRVTAMAHRWADLIRELSAHGPFESCNDQAVEQFLQNAEATQLESDRKRKAKEAAESRLANARQGEFSPEVLEMLEQRKKAYVVNHAIATLRPDGPSFLKQCPEDASNFDSDVLVASEMLAIAKVNVNPNSTARQLHRMGLYTDRPVNNLRQRVRSAQDRIARLKRLTLPGEAEPVFPRFKIVDAIKGIP